MSRVRRVVVGALVAVSASACSGGGSGGASTSASLPEPSMTMYPSTQNSPTTTPSGSASKSATPTGTATTTAVASAAATASIPEPVLPAEAKAHTPDGAAAFARHFFEVANYAWQRPAAGAIPGLSAPSCKSCANMERLVNELVSTNGRFDQAPLKVTSSDPGHATPEGEQTVIVVAQQTPARVTRPSGLSTPSKSMKVIRQVALRYSDGWKVTAIRTVE